ncbi:MAG TPA: class F sortase [Streptosporangiaceae bacterium]
MDDSGRRGRPPGRTMLADRGPAKRKAAVAGRLDDWWDPAWDAAWWDPVWDPEGAEPVVATSTPMPTVTPDDAGASAAAVPTAVPLTSPAASAEPSWGQVLATTIRLWVSRHQADAQRSGPQAGAQGPDGNRKLRRSSVRRPAAQGASVPRGAVRGLAVPRMPARLLAASMLGAGLLAAGAGTAGLLVASSPSAAPVRWAARPSPVPVPSGRTAAPAWLATVQNIARPVWLTVPAIGVRTRLVDLGLNQNGTLQVPDSTTVAGWFTGSPRPGAIGSAVIAGHVDSRTGPAIFFWLRTIRPGERIYVGRADGTMAVFTVTSVRMYPKDEFPTAAVYGPVPDAELRLITCGGIFDESRGSYLSNVVVFARLTG